MITDSIVVEGRAEFGVYLIVINYIHLGMQEHDLNIYCYANEMI